MKGKRIFLMVSAILLILTIVLASCGGGGPKSLAKQFYDLTQRIEAAGGLFNIDEDSALGKEFINLTEKIEKLSEADQDIFEEELERLMDQD